MKNKKAIYFSHAKEIVKINTKDSFFYNKKKKIDRHKNNMKRPCKAGWPAFCINVLDEAIKGR